MTPKTKLLSIVELGGYPDMSRDYEAAGFDVTTINSQRKALKSLKTRQPDVIIAEFNYTPDFRDRICNLDTLVSQIRIMDPAPRLVVLFEQEDSAPLARFRRIYQPDAELMHPVSAAAVIAAAYGENND